MKQLIFPMEERFEVYLSDESRLIGSAESISFPETDSEVAEIILQLKESDIPITVQGGKTGIVGSAVPNGGHIMNLSKLNKVKDFKETSDGNFLITVEAGITLMELEQEIQRAGGGKSLFWPPEPTETTATVGGVISQNAKGICASVYGDTGNYIESIRVIGEDSEVTNIQNNLLSEYFLGGEGMYGVITEASLILLKRPAAMWGITFFFGEDSDVYKFTELLKEQKLTNAARIAAMEYMDRNTIDIIEQHKSMMTKIKDIPDIDPDANALIYLEIHGDEEEQIEEIAEILMEIACDCSSDPDTAWAVSGESEIDRMRHFRHSAAEAANLEVESNRLNDKRITKLGSDMCLEHGTLSEVLEQYKKDLNHLSFKYCIFGHIPETHLHVNIFPENYEDYCKGKELMKDWAVLISSKGGCPMAEHGVGKLKKELFSLTAKQDCLNELTERKKHKDPKLMWNPGNMLELSTR